MELPEHRGQDLKDVLNPYPPEISMIPPGTWETLKRHKTYHAEQGNGFGYSLIKQPYKGKVTRTLLLGPGADKVYGRDLGWGNELQVVGYGKDNMPLCRHIEAYFPNKPAESVSSR